MDFGEKTYGSALNAMQRYCAKRETCIYDIRRKLTYYSLSDVNISKILDELIKDGFINEERYAKIFVRDKFKFNKWGKIKIGYQLRAKMIPEKLISIALKEIQFEDYDQLLTEEISKKVKSNMNEMDKAKIVRNFQSKGFELELILKVWNSIKDN